jgi:lipopolysaccharide transport system ATP-binding protein
VVLVTHDLAAVDLHCDRAILFDHGRVLADAGAHEVTARYERMVGEARDTGGPADQDAEPDRWGNGAVRFGSIRLLGADGHERHGFATDDAMTMAFDLTARDRVTDLVLGIGVHRADGSVIAGTNTNIAQVALPELSPGDELHVEYRLPRLGLLNGGYRLTVAAHPKMHTVTYDHREQAVDFSVTDTSGRAGLFELGGEFVVQEGAARISAASRRR